MTVKKSSKKNNIFLRFHPLHRIIIGLILGCVAFFIRPNNIPSLIKVMIFWDVFALTYIVLTWIVVVKRPISEIKQTAKSDDPSAVYHFFFIIIASLASMFTILLLMLSQSDKSSPDSLYLPVAIAGMMLSWVLVHMIYLFYYAHMYYDEDKNEMGKDASGLDFPGNEQPDYLDFAYFSFVIGCTFQVSDVEITSHKIRRTVLFHGLLSFALNTFVVALTINLIAGLTK